MAILTAISASFVAIATLEVSFVDDYHLQLERLCSWSGAKRKKADTHAIDSRTDAQIDREMRACAAAGVKELV